MTAHVFISYSRKDSEFVEKLERDLQARGFVTWRDAHNIPGGEDWYDAIVGGLNNAYAMLCIVSPNADESRWVRREQLYADQRGIPRIPVLPAPHTMPVHLIETQPIPCHEAEYQSGLARLTAAINSVKARAASTPAPTPTAPDTLSANVKTYLDFLLAEAQGDLRDALYVSLGAAPEKARAVQAPARSPLAFGLDMDLDVGFGRLDLEQIKGEAFDQSGETVPDARVPIKTLRRVILLGEPGAGKTTTLLQLAVDLARAAQKDAAAPLPVVVPLRQYNGATSFEAFVQQQLATLQSDYARLIDGRLILLCDALNEMPRKGVSDGRDLLADVRDYLRDKSDWVVSCRVRDYQEELSDLDAVGKVRLKPLDPPRIYDVIRRRFAEQYAPRQIATAQDGETLWQVIGGSGGLLRFWEQVSAHNEESRFWDANAGAPSYTSSADDNDWYVMQRDKRRAMHLCRNPYMTKMICDIYALDKSLPDNRGMLFKKFVDKLLERDRKAAEAVGAAWLDDAIIRRGLAQIAYRMGAETEMARVDAEAILREVLSSPPDPLSTSQARREGEIALLLRLAMGASLLDVGETVRFTHQLLQEYFASEVLGALLDDPQGAAGIWTPDKWWNPTGREETVVILAGVRGDPEGVARWLADAQPELALEVLRDSGVPVDLVQLEAATREKILTSARAKTAEPNPVGRAAAYRVLGALNADDRPGVGLRADGLPDILWCDVPAGTFLMGSDKGKDPQARDNELPQREVYVEAFQISKYPITNAQFQAFLDDPEGYNHPAWWTNAGLEWKGDRTAPDEVEDPHYRLPNHPRVYVRWYEAVAYCNWLNAKMRSVASIPTVPTLNPSPRNGEGLETTPPLYEARVERGSGGEDFIIRLPTESEWEKAARGTDGRIYPYEGTFDPTKGNSRETGIGQTSAVGIFPDGASPYHVLDMSGNVWEWCASKYRSPNDNSIDGTDVRLLRGGAFYASPNFVRAAVRVDLSPSNWYDYVGFRVVRAFVPS